MLRRAGVEPAGWVINRCLAAAGDKASIFVERAHLESAEIKKVTASLATKVAIVPSAARGLGWERHWVTICI
jgi:arsenite/tail-anchored protein-transporting ATPase